MLHIRARTDQAAPLREVTLPFALLRDRFELSNRVRNCLGLKERFKYSVLAVSHHFGKFPLHHPFERVVHIWLNWPQNFDLVSYCE